MMRKRDGEKRETFIWMIKAILICENQLNMCDQRSICIFGSATLAGKLVKMFL